MSASSIPPTSQVHNRNEAPEPNMRGRLTEEYLASATTFDIAAEIELLQLTYERFCREKQHKEEQKKRKMERLLARGPTERQNRWYEEGRTRLRLLRAKANSEVEEAQAAERRDDSSSPKDPAPIPVCNRLYEQGMLKIRASKLAEEKRKGSVMGSGGSKTIAILACDRLYRAGMRKLKAEKMAEQRAEAKLEQYLINRFKPSYNPVFDRLYEEGMNKLRAEKWAEQRTEEEFEHYMINQSKPSSNPVCDRLYEQGLRKIKARKAEENTEQELQRDKVRFRVAPNPACDRLYTAGINKIMDEKLKNQTWPPLQQKLQLQESRSNDMYMGEKLKNQTWPALHQKLQLQALISSGTDMDKKLKNQTCSALQQKLRLQESRSNDTYMGDQKLKDQTWPALQEKVQIEPSRSNDTFLVTASYDS